MSTLTNRAAWTYQLKKQIFTSLNNVTLTPVSKWLGSLASSSFLKKYPIKPIYNGIDTSIFKPSASKLREKLGLNDKFVIVTAASVWIAEKGLEDYKKLATMLRDDEVMILIGVPEPIKRTLPQNMIVISRTDSQQELAQYYTMADVVLNLSYQETFGLTTVEGMACGTPVVVYNKTACPELVTPATGVVLDPGNLSDVLCAFDEIKKKGKQYYSHACRKRAVEEYDMKRCYIRYISLYNRLIYQNADIANSKLLLSGDDVFGNVAGNKNRGGKTLVVNILPTYKTEFLIVGYVA